MTSKTQVWAILMVSLQLSVQIRTRTITRVAAIITVALTVAMNNLSIMQTMIMMIDIAMARKMARA